MSIAVQDLEAQVLGLPPEDRARLLERLIAEAFLAEYERVLGLLLENQQRGPDGGHGMRIYHFDRFPCTVIYAEDASLGPQIFAIAHQSREPAYWSSRL
ncbi:hypothetical protein [Variovorax sp. CF079]|uniref:hypothetical protein n=1 Tax=Variovorax sp. CF079 TaxID=1882774 RepID=UPI000B8121D4|nr:hypothetical protein [Variovorax sp. CF079]